MTNGLLACPTSFPSGLQLGLLSMYHHTGLSDHRLHIDNASVMNSLVSGSTAENDNEKYVRYGRFDSDVQEL